MTTLFFVHGTGVRDAGYQQTLSDIKNGLKAAGKGSIPVVGVSWGSAKGVKVTPELTAAMLPVTAAKGADLTTAEDAAALWAMLMDDPLFELRLVALTPPASLQNPPGAQSTGSAVLTRLKAFSLSETPEGGVPAQTLKAAANWLTSGAPGIVVGTAAAVTMTGDPALVEAVARALVARALLDSRGEPGVGPDALYVSAARDRLVEQIERQLSGGVKGPIAQWFKNALKGFVLGKATALGRDRRTDLMGSVSPGMGDILLTQRRGQDVVDMVRSGIEAIQDDVVVIGHSLGGVHLVNLLSGPNPPARVTRLITVGSQSAFFTACDAMESLRLGAALPSGFPKWLNIYDRSDFLSFCAARSFAGGVIEDFEVASGVPFPDSHGAYWRNPDVYKKIATVL